MPALSRRCEAKGDDTRHKCEVEIAVFPVLVELGPSWEPQIDSSASLSDDGVPKGRHGVYCRIVA